MKPSSSDMMTALREHFGGHEPFQAALRTWREAHPISGTTQWPPTMHAVEQMHEALQAGRLPKPV